MATLATISIALVYLASVLTALLVIQSGQHRSRGAIAWVIALVGLPWIALPLYWMSGQVRYGEYRNSRKETQRLLGAALQPLLDDDSKSERSANSDQTRVYGEQVALARFSLLPTSVSNRTLLYSESEEALSDLKKALENAKHYILLQSYLLRDDTLGTEVGELLVSAVERGCQVYVLYDELGSDEMSGSFKTRLREANVNIIGFSENRRFLPKLRMNFRNHRKILVVDGLTGFVGGMNLGDEYVDGADQFSSWRDTHMKIKGPAVLSLQLSFIEDWRFANKGNGGLSTDSLYWSKQKTEPAREERQAVTICDIGPHRNTLSGDVLFTTLLEAAERRLWIATPYFVPDDRVISTLKSAALRGVDVRVIVPKKSDHRIFPRVHQEFARELSPYGIKLFAFEPGFMHQKVMLIDNKYGCVGSANFDNRSLRLNFETLAVVYGATFCAQLENMLESDLDQSSQIKPDTLPRQGVFSRLLSRSTRLLSPVL